MIQRKLYCDMDGVVADFDYGYFLAFGCLPPDRATRKDSDADKVMWKRIRAYKHFFLSLPETVDAQVLWRFIRPHQPTMLTGINETTDPLNNEKREWIVNHFGRSTSVICCEAAEKSVFCNQGDVIIDDLPKHRAKWEERGGIWVLHKDAQSTIAQLKDLGF